MRKSKKQKLTDNKNKKNNKIKVISTSIAMFK